MLSKISENIWKLNVDSNVYLLDFEAPIVIDSGPALYKRQVKYFLGKVVPAKSVEVVIFTHLHMDHSGNYDLFENASFFSSKHELMDLKENPERTTLASNISHYSELIKKIKPIEDLKLKDIRVINTPGHTKGSICLLYKPKNILFSGDTLFEGGFGRVDLPTSDPKNMEKSLEKLKKIKYKILAPGHDY